MTHFYKHQLIVLTILLCSVFAAKSQTTSVDKYGQLQIKNGKVSDHNGNPVVLRGVSLYWSCYQEGIPFYNATTIKWLRDDWCVDVVRIPMAVDVGSTNYLNNPTAVYNMVKTVIDACVTYGLYVVVDFHTHNANNYEPQAKTFFQQVANDYGNQPNVIYEPFNEPVSQDWNSVVKPYHNALISTIRAIDPDNIIVCGTTTYSQDVDIAANDQVTGTNVAYTLHYYAGSHGSWLMQKATNALNGGIAIFVTEYGTCDASGNGNYNPSESQAWWNYVESNMLSSCNWAVENKNETAAILTPGTTALSNWTTGQLSTSGQLVRNYIKGKCNVLVTTGSVTLSFTGNQTQFNKGDAVTISAATTVANGSIAKVNFYDNGTLIGSDATSPYSLTTSTLSAGGHNIYAISEDGSGNEIGTSPTYVINIIGSSDISTTGITDQFEDTAQYNELTGGLTGTSCTNPTSAAAVGVYWWNIPTNTKGFSATYSRPGNGTLIYTVTQPTNNYDVFGLSFGQYCDNGTLKDYTLDLTQNSVFSVTVSTPNTNTVSIDMNIQMVDINGTTLAIEGAYLNETSSSNWYKYQIGFSKNHTTPDFISLSPGSSVNFTYDYQNALSINNPKNPSFPTDINTSSAPFDFTKVKQIIFGPENSADNGAAGGYQPLAFSNQEIIFSGLKLGDPSLGPNFCTTPPIPTVSNKTYCQNTAPTALTATKVSAFALKWYTAASGGNASNVAPIPSTSVAGTQTYYVTQAPSFSSTCESPRTPITVTVVGAPTANAGSDQTGAMGPSITLAGSGSATGTWSTVSKQSGTTISFSPSANSASVSASGLSVQGVYTFEYTVAGTAPCKAVSDTVNVTISSVTSLISGTLSDNSIEIYPNPVTDNLNVDMSQITGTKSVKLSDMTGRVLLETTGENLVNLETTNLTKGMYIIQIKSESGTLVKTIMKR